MDFLFYEKLYIFLFVREQFLQWFIVFCFLSLNLFSDMRLKEPIHYSGEKLGLGSNKDFKVSKDFYDFSKNKNL